MLSKNMVDALSAQVNAEYYSAYLYLSMSAAAGTAGLKGAANWLFVQAKEETSHGTRIYKYLLERGAAPSFAGIDEPPSSFSSINDIFEKVLAHEQLVSERINAIATLAMQELDHATYQFILWFVEEQIEEEASVNEILDKLRLLSDSKGSLFAIDTELGARVFDDSTQTKAE